MKPVAPVKPVVPVNPVNPAHMNRSHLTLARQRTYYRASAVKTWYVDLAAEDVSSAQRL